MTQQLFQVRNASELGLGFFRLAVEACPSGIVVVDDRGRIVMANREIERLFGYESREMHNQSIEMLLPEKLRETHTHQRANFEVQPRARHMGMGREFSGRRKDGREFPIEVGLNPFQVGSAAFVLAAIVDISERKRIQQLQDEFVSTVSHELRTPLTSIAASLGLLAGGKAGTLPDSAARLITIAHSNCQRLIGLVNDILDVKKIESGQMALHIQRCDARLLLAEAVEANRPLAESRSVHIEYEILLHEHFIDVDPDRFVQVATNLLSNAINFSPRDKAVVVSIAKSGRNVRIAVRDHGGGIPADFKHRVFERFTQADATTTKKKGGTGLGLSIARQIVELMKGRIGFEDAAGGGTIFFVEFPAAEDLAKATDICIDDKTAAPPVAADDCPLLPF